jgi:hypothetical protein
MLNKYPIFLTTIKLKFLDRSGNFNNMGRFCLILVMFNAMEYMFQHIFQHWKIHLNRKKT